MAVKSCWPLAALRRGLTSSLALIALTVLQLPAPTPCAADAQVALAQARAAAARGDRDGTIAALERAVAQDPGLALAHRWLSRLYAEKGLREQAVAQAAAAILTAGEPDDGRRLARLLADGPPEWLARRDADAIPLEKISSTVEPLDDRAATRAPCQALLIVADRVDHPATDPRFGWRFDSASYGYVLDCASDRWVLAVIAHHDSSGGEARRTLAVKCAGLLLRAACARLAYVGPSSPHQQPLHLWIADGGKPGAESWGPDIYLFAAAMGREPAEWLREILHECGHAALPGATGFAEPEPWANGRLGEQLLSRWLAMARVSPGHDWLSAETMASLRADADRCLDLFCSKGPGSPLLADRSSEGMDFYLGFANYVERAFGARLLASAMHLSAGNTSRGFAIGVQEALRRDLPAGVELRAMENMPADKPAIEWIYLPAVKVRASCVGGWRGVRPDLVKVNFNGRMIGTTESDLGRIAEGWHAIRLPAGAVMTFRAVTRAGP
jgi:hypothetical protein